jgi:hypothetical protein
LEFDLVDPSKSSDGTVIESLEKSESLGESSEEIVMTPGYVDRICITFVNL